jgi:protein TonB
VGAPPINLGDAPNPPVTKPEPINNDKPVDRIIKVSEGPLLGKAIHIPVPVYPILAKNAGVEGSVKVELMLDKTGHVISATAVSGPPLLRSAAQQAAKESLFRPTLLSGEAVMVEAVITFNFKIR